MAVLENGTWLKGRYRIVNHIAEGGMADIYLALDTKRGHPVALKFLKPEYHGYYHMLAQEAQFLKDLNHDNIVRFYEFEADMKQLFISMAYVKGKTLKEVLEGQASGLPLDVVRRVIEGIGSALHFIHQEGRVHRDVKPSNIILEDDTLRAILTDFGVAGAYGHQSDSGTPMYMSPEQVVGQEQKPSSDVYAFALVVYEMLTGKIAFDGNTTNPSAPDETRKRIMWQQVHEYPTPVSSHRGDLPQAVDNVLRRGFEKDEAKRYQTVSDFVKEFLSALNSAEASKKRRIISFSSKASNVNITQTIDKNPPTQGAKNKVASRLATLLVSLAILSLIVGVYAVASSVPLDGSQTNVVAAEETVLATSTRLPSSTPNVTSTRIMSGDVQPSSTSEVTQTNTPRGRLSPTSRVTSTPSATASMTASPSATGEVIVSAQSTDTGVTATATRLPTETFTPTVTRTPTRMPTRTPTPTPTPYVDSRVITSQNGVNLRNSASRSGSVVILVPANALVSIIGKSQNELWYYVNYNTYTGWITYEVFSLTDREKRILPIIESR